MFFRIRKAKRVKKQEALFIEALKETGYLLPDESMRIDHVTGECFYKDSCYSIIFPLRFLRQARQLDYHKIYDFSFRGINSPKRDWVSRFDTDRSKITFTDKGRKLPKDEFDVGYYQEIARSKFTLCPAGDFQWTYRFLEAIMCHSIPIVDAGCMHPHFEGFSFFQSNMEYDDLLSAWDDLITKKNYLLFLRRHTLLDQFVFL